MNAFRRMSQHSSRSPWFSEIANITLEHFETRKLAEEAERTAILIEDPKYTTIPKGPKQNKHESHPAGRKNAMTEERVEKTKEMLDAGEPVSAILPVLKDMEGPTIGRSRLFDWVKDYRLSEEPSDPTDDR